MCHSGLISGRGLPCSRCDWPWMLAAANYAAAVAVVVTLTGVKVVAWPEPWADCFQYHRVLPLLEHTLVNIFLIHPFWFSSSAFVKVFQSAAAVVWGQKQQQYNNNNLVHQHSFQRILNNHNVTKNVRIETLRCESRYEMFTLIIWTRLGQINDVIDSQQNCDKFNLQRLIILFDEGTLQVSTVCFPVTARFCWFSFAPGSSSRRRRRCCSCRSWRRWPKDQTSLRGNQDTAHKNNLFQIFCFSLESLTTLSQLNHNQT